MKRVLSLLITLGVAQVLAAEEHAAPPLDQLLYGVLQQLPVKSKQGGGSSLDEFLYGPSQPTAQAVVYTLPIPQPLVNLARQESLPLEEFLQVDSDCEAVTSNADRTLFYARCNQIPRRVAIPGFAIFPLPLPQNAGQRLRFTLPLQGQDSLWLNGERIGPGRLSLPIETIGKLLCFKKDRTAKHCIEHTITLRAVLEQRPLRLNNDS